MVKSKSSMTGSESDRRFYENQRAGFHKIAEQAALGRSAINRNIAETARAAEQLVGTDRARELLANKSLRALRGELLKAHGIITSNVMSDIASAVEAASINKPINLPLGSGFTGTEWLAVAEAIQDYSSYLHGYGYTDAEIAAALAYGRYLIREA